MKKKMIISAIIVSGGLLLAGQAIGQFQTFQQEQAERSGERVYSTEGSSPQTPERASPQAYTGREDRDDDQQSGLSGADQQRSRESSQQFTRQRSPQQQGQLQQDFGVSPKYNDDMQSRQQTQNRSDDQPGETDLTRDQGSSAFPGFGQGQRDGSQQSGSGSSGGFGGQGGQGGSGGR